MSDPTPHDVRHFARLGALAMVRRALALFPDIRAELDRDLEPQLRASKRAIAAVVDDRPRRRRRPMSAAARARIGAAQRRIWRERKRRQKQASA